MKSYLFISDLHLSQDRVDITSTFLDFLTSNQNKHHALYILGDLFESWIGDDDVSEFTNLIANAIKNFSCSCPVYFIHGNRDFLLGKTYAKRSGMTLLPEQHHVTLFNHKVLLMHGDELCLDDVDYQKFRAKARSWWWQTIIKLLPLSWRRKKAQQYRKISSESQKYKSEDIMDVADRAVQQVFNNNNIDFLIHGHTHRPAIHDLRDDKKRIVLGDWYEQGSVLTINEHGAELSSIPFNKDESRKHVTDQ